MAGNETHGNEARLMGHFIGEETERLDLGAGEWVDIKKRMNWGDQQRLVASYMKLQTGQSVTPQVDVSLETGNMTLMVINIKGWNLKDDANKDVPVTSDAIASLDIETATKILNAINERNPAPKV